MNEGLKDIGSGFFIRFSTEEFKEVELYLISNEYEVSPAGMKEAFLDAIFEGEEGEKKKNPILKAFEDNPELIQKAGEGFINLASKFFDKKKV